MERKPSSLGEAIIYAVFGLLCCVGVGVLLAGTNVFVPTRPPFQFLVYGLTGAVLFFTLKFGATRNFLYITALLFMLEITATVVTQPRLLLLRLLQFVGFAAAVFVHYHLHARLLQKLRFARFLVLGGLVAIVNFIMVLLVIGFTGELEARLLIEGQLLTGFLIGSSLGIGFEIADQIKTRLLQTGTA